MAFWLSRFVDTAQGVVPVVARDQYVLDGQVSSWWDMSKHPGTVGGYALVDTPSVREAWHNPLDVYFLGVGLQDQVYAYTFRELTTRLDLDARITVLGAGVNARANQDVIDLGSTTLVAGDTVGVEFSTAPGLADRPYWVVESDGRYIRVATTQGGTRVDITGNGTCTVYQTRPVWRAIRWLARNAPRYWRQPPVDYDGTCTITVGSRSWTFDQDDEPAPCLDPPVADTYPPIDRGV